MNKSNPKISILMCVYNGEKHLEEAIESIINQSFKNFEFIIVDDGSTDKTSHIILEYANEDSRIVSVHNEKNIGLEKSLNKGLSVVKGEYFARQDDDDVSLPHRLELQNNFLDNHPEIGAIGTAVELIDKQGNTVSKQFLPTDHESLQALLFINNFMHHSTLMARSSLMKGIGGYREDMRFVEDYDLWWRLSCLSRLATLPDILLRRRINSVGITSNNREKQLENSFKISSTIIQKNLDNQYLDQIAYQKFWWNILRTLDKQSYQKFWLNKYGEDARLQNQDIQKLQPVWNFLSNHPYAGKIWSFRIKKLAIHILLSGRILEGLKLLFISGKFILSIHFFLVLCCKNNLI